MSQVSLPHHLAQVWGQMEKPQRSSNRIWIFSLLHLLMFNQWRRLCDSSPPDCYWGGHKAARGAKTSILGEILFAGSSEMGPWLAWSLAATFTLAAFSDGGYGAESPNALPEAEDESGKRDLELLRIPRTTQRQRSRMTAYRTGSLSALSRGLMTNLSAPGKERGEQIRRERGASQSRDLGLGCNRTLLPSHTGSREGDSSKRPRSSQKSRDSDSLEVPFRHHNLTGDGEQQKAKEWLPQIIRKDKKKNVQHFQAT